MSRWTLIMAVLVGCLAVGYAGGRREVKADDPSPCDKYECRDTHAYWSASDPLNVSAYYSPVDGTTPLFQAEIDIFAPGSTGKQPTSGVTGVNVRKRRHTACYPACGLHPQGGKWQSVQVVFTHGNPELGFNVAKLSCTSAGGIGPLSMDQTNNNPDGNVPPQPPAPQPE